MKSFSSGLLAAALVATVGLSAQEQTPRTPAPAPGSGTAGRGSPQAPAATAGKSMTVDGCVQSAEAPASSNANVAQAPKFVLAVKPAPGAPGRGAAGTAGNAGTRYQLDGEDKTIAPHLNHQVEVTGTLQPATATAGGGAGSILKVESLKMVAAICS